MTDVMYLPGVVGHYASTPDSAAVSITGDSDIRVRVAANSWVPGATLRILCKRGSASTISYDFYVGSTGALGFGFTGDGSTSHATASTAIAPFSAGQAGWVRVVRNATSGVIRYYTAADQTGMPASWTQLGTDTSTTSGAIYDGATVVEIGSANGGTAGLLPGRFYRAQIRNNILDDGSGIVFDADFTDRGNTFVEDSSNHATVTIWGRLQGYEPTWLPAEALYGNANHYGYEMKKLDAPEPMPKTTHPAATGGTVYPVAR